jgi:hypothetical protein
MSAVLIHVEQDDVETLRATAEALRRLIETVDSLLLGSVRVIDVVDVVSDLPVTADALQNDDVLA